MHLGCVLKLLPILELLMVCSCFFLQLAAVKKGQKKLSKKQEKQLEQAIAKRKKHWALLARRDVYKVLLFRFCSCS